MAEEKFEALENDPTDEEREEQLQDIEFENNISRLEGHSKKENKRDFFLRTF